MHMPGRNTSGCAVAAANKSATLSVILCNEALEFPPQQAVATQMNAALFRVTYLLRGRFHCIQGAGDNITAITVIVYMPKKRTTEDSAIRSNDQSHQPKRKFTPVQETNISDAASLQASKKPKTKERLLFPTRPAFPAATAAKPVRLICQLDTNVLRAHCSRRR